MKRILKLLSSWLQMFILGRRGVRILPLSYVASDCEFEGPNYIDRYCNVQQTRMGRFSYIGYGSSVYGARIGRFCSIASGVKVGLGVHPVDHVSTSPVFYSQKNVFGKKWIMNNKYESEQRDVIIGNDVWIGANAIIMSGIRIGSGAIVAACAVVTKDIEPYTIVGGIPAKILKNRFPLEIAHAIEETAWWDFEEVQLKSNANLFPDPSVFINKINSKKIYKNES